MTIAKRFGTWVVLGLMTSAMGGFAYAQAPAATAAPEQLAAKSVPGSHDPSDPAPKTGRSGGRFMKMHEQFLKRGKEGPIGLLFLGDSITERWGIAPEIWKKYYGQYEPANFGIGGDRVEHVLWRVDNGELDGIHPKVLVLMLGTNNTMSNSAEQIAAGDVKLVKEIREKLPETKVLLLAVFPRGPRKPTTRVSAEEAQANAEMQMAKIRAVNAELAKLDDGKNVRYLDIGEKFMVDGKIPDEIMPDQLHPSVKGYQIWADAMQPTLEEMMKD